MERDLAQGPALTGVLVELLIVECSEADVPNQGQPAQPTPRLVQVLLGEGCEIADGGDHRPVPCIGLGGLVGQPGFHLGEVVYQMVHDAPYRLVRRVRARRFALNRHFYRLPIPTGPGLCQLKHVINHGGDNIRGMPFVDNRSRVDQEEQLVTCRRQLPAVR